MQLPAPVFAWNLPALQSVQATAPDPEYTPAPQIAQDPEPIKEKRPTAHSEQAVEPAAL